MCRQNLLRYIAKRDHEQHIYYFSWCVDRLTCGSKMEEREFELLYKRNVTICCRKHNQELIQPQYEVRLFDDCAKIKRAQHFIPTNTESC